MGQAAFCWITSSTTFPRVNGFYKDLTTLHLLAMSLTFPTALLLRVIPVPLGTVWRDEPDAHMLFDGTYSRAASYGDGRDDGAYPTAASYAFLSLLIFFSLHSVSNCCRVIFDACGEGVAKSAVIPAALCQLWNLWPSLTFTFSLQMTMLILTTIDYVQHLAGCTYWAAVAYHARRASAARCRALYGVCGGALHMLSIVPLVSYHVATFEAYPTERPDPWVCVPLVGLAVGLMASAQTCWIKMALLTPQAATRLAMVHAPRGGQRAPSPQLPRAAMRKKRQGQNERSYHPEPRLAQSSTAVDTELSAGERSQISASEPRSYVHTDFSLPQTTPDYIANYPDDLVVVVSGTPPPPPALLPAPPGGEVDVWASAHSEEDVWAEAQTEQGETYYYHIVTGETTWERHYVL